MPALSLVIAFLCGLLAAPTAQAGELNLAVASNFIAPMQEIATAFQRQSGHRLQLIFGSSGKLYAQIRHGAPFQMLLAADDKTPGLLEQESLAVPGTRFVYAIGKLVLWSPLADYVDPQGRILGTRRYQHLAIADPRLAPYGQAAWQVLDRLGLQERVRDKLVQGESIAQAYQFVATGNAELGFVALSQVLSAAAARRGSFWIVPTTLYTPLRQEAIILAGGKDNAAALALSTFLRGEQARAIMHTYGYSS